MLRFVIAGSLCAATAAQIPEGHLVYVHRTPSNTIAPPISVTSP